MNTPNNAAALERLAAIGELIRTQDNRITDAPIFIVQQKRVRVADPDYDNDGIVWVNDDNQEAGEADHSRLEAAYPEEGEPEGWRRLAIRHEWEFVTACFTEQGCKDYIARDGHNLREPRIYAAGSYRNEEWRAVREYLATLAQPDALTSLPSGGTEAEDRFEQYVATLIDKNPDVRRLGERLAYWLDEDRFNTVNPILLGICERLATHPSADAPGVAVDEARADILALEVARRFTLNTEPQRRASLQCAVVDAIKRSRLPTADESAGWEGEPSYQDLIDYVTAPTAKADTLSAGMAVDEVDRDAARFRWAVASKQFQYWLDADSEEEARKAIDAALAPKPEGKTNE